MKVEVHKGKEPTFQVYMNYTAAKTVCTMLDKIVHTHDCPHEFHIALRRALTAYEGGDA
jgi:hypothetical protein